MKPDYSLYLVTDRMRMSTKTLGEAVEQAVIGGCTMVQLREKEILSLDFYVLASEMKKITDRYVQGFCHGITPCSNWLIILSVTISYTDLLILFYLPIKKVQSP